MLLSAYIYVWNYLPVGLFLGKTNTEMCIVDGFDGRFLFFYFKDLVEKVMILRKSIERLRNCEVAVQSPILAEKLTCYAGILAAEGSLTTAMTYLPENSDQVRSSFIQHWSPYNWMLLSYS